MTKFCYLLLAPNNLSDYFLFNDTKLVKEQSSAKKLTFNTKYGLTQTILIFCYLLSIRNFLAII